MKSVSRNSTVVGCQEVSILRQMYVRQRTTDKQYWYSVPNVGRVSSVGITTRYELDGPAIEYRWGRDFLHPTTRYLGPTQPPVK